MLIKYIDRKFGAAALEIIGQANAIIAEYQAQGFDLTLRQLYYQFVARDLIANKMREYKRLGSIINDARLAGLISWAAIVDRTRNLESNSHWESPAEIVETCAKQFQIDKWATQEARVEVWIEKDAIIGVIEGVCRDLDVPYFSCRGYTSQSEIWSAGQRLRRYIKADQQPVIIHLGDHDPSGVDMTRDIADRLRLFTGRTIEVNRIALNMNQIEQYQPPPNPAKITDSRARSYIKLHGHESWELDALDPATLGNLIRDTINEYVDADKWDEAIDVENEHRKTLKKIVKKLNDD